MPHKDSSLLRLARQLTAVIMAHGIASVAHAQTTNKPPAEPAPATTTPGNTNSNTNTTTKLPEVVVTGQKEATPYQPATAALPKFTEPLLDTPQSVSVVPRQLMDDQNNTTLRDALRNVAGISIAAGEGGAQGDNLTLRGFTARNDIFQDGMRDFGSYYRDPFNIEQVEALKGPASVMFGRGSTGGIINQTTKTPHLDGFVNGSLSLGTDMTKRSTLDINEPVKPLGNGTAFRLNAMGTDSEVAGRDIAETRRFGVAPSFAFGLGTPTRVVVSYFHQTSDDIPDYGVPWYFDRPAPVRRENYYGFEHGNYLRTDVDMGTVKVEHDFNSMFTLRDQIRYANSSRDVRITEARIAAGVTPATPLDAINVTRNQIVARSDESFFQNQADLTSRFDTGPVNHTLVSGIEAGWESSDPTRQTYAGVPGTNLLNPDESQAFAGTATTTSKVKTTATSVGLYAVDTMKYGEHWELAGGARWDYFGADYTQSVGALQHFERVDQMPSWRGALVYKPVSIGSVYFSYGTSFNPSAETLALSAANANLPPEENETFEFGTKWEFLQERLTLRAAVFRTEKSNAREPDPNNPLLNVLAGKQRVDGVEFEAGGKLTEKWNISAGYAYLDGTVIESKAFPASVGAQLANAPRNTFSFWTTYELPWKLEIGGGGRFVDDRTASSTAPTDPVTGKVKKAPDYVVFDAMLKYHLTKNIDVQFNVYNLANAEYYDQIHPAHIVPGAGRSMVVTTSFKF